MTVPTHGVDHLVACRRNDERGWCNLHRLNGVWHEHHTRTNGLLRPAIDTLLDDITRNPDADVSFTSRRMEDLVSEPLAEWADDLKGYVVGGSIVTLLPEREVASDLWTSLWRDGRGKLHGGGREPRFRLAALTEQVDEFFKRENIRSFEPPTRADGQPSAVPMNRPAYERELLIRRTWCLAAILPDAVPPKLMPRLSKEQEAEQEAKLRAFFNRKKARERTRQQLEDAQRVKAHNERIERANQRPT
jgi:hypothetical protein